MVMKMIARQKTPNIKPIQIIFFLLFFTIGKVLCYKNENTNTTLHRSKRTTSGVNADVTDFPYAVALINDGAFACNGNILGPYHVITACHCTTDFIPKNFQIRAGSSYWDESGSLHDVISYACDPRFNDQSILEYDVAILVINKPFKLDNITQRAITIWKPNKQSLQQVQAQSATWGIHKFEIQQQSEFADYSQSAGEISSQFQVHTEFPKQMQYSKSIFDDPRVRSREYHEELTDPQLILPRPMKSVIGSICGGDSGGGLIVEGKLAGVISVGRGGECHPIHAIADPLVSIDWIETFVNSTSRVIEQALKKKYTTYLLSESKIETTATRNEVWAIEKSSHVVSILKSDWLLCSGSIVSDSHVVTAAHCFKNRSINEITVRSGSSYWHTGGNLHRVIQIVSHPLAEELTSGWINDVAVVQIDGSFNFDYKTEQPINLYSYADFNTSYYPKMRGFIDGWVDYVVINNDTDKAVMPSLKIQRSNVSLEESEFCYNRESIALSSADKPYKHTILCASTPDNLSSKIIYGASGSGLVVDGKLAGVATQLSTVNDKIQRFMAISSVNRWIKQLINPETTVLSSSSDSVIELQHGEELVRLNITDDFEQSFKSLETLLSELEK